MSLLTTQDGTTIVVHPIAGTVSARSKEEALREVARRVAAQQGRAA